MEVQENTNQNVTPQEGNFNDLENVTSEILLKILAEEGNDICFDCGIKMNSHIKIVILALSRDRFQSMGLSE